LLDEYERAIGEMKTVLKSFSNEDLVEIVDPATKDEDCRSVQTVLTHVVRAGICYIIYIRNAQGENLKFVERKRLATISSYDDALDKMFSYAEQLFVDYPNLKLEAFEQTDKIKVAWNQYYDAEQLLEHAIVHVLRHRRQLERFSKLLKIN